METKQFLADHTPNRGIYLAGELNTHHPDWYGELAPDRSGVILTSARSGEYLVEWTNKYQ